MHQVFFKARKLVLVQRSLIYAHDELRMAASRLQLATEYEAGRENHVLYKFELQDRLEVSAHQTGRDWYTFIFSYNCGNLPHLQCIS